MVSLWKWMILTPLQKLPKNGEDWGKLIVAKGVKKLAKIQNIAQSGHTARGSTWTSWEKRFLSLILLKEKMPFSKILKLFLKPSSKGWASKKKLLGIEQYIKDR